MHVEARGQTAYAGPLSPPQACILAIRLRLRGLAASAFLLSSLKLSEDGVGAGDGSEHLGFRLP